MWKKEGRGKGDRLPFSARLSQKNSRCRTKGEELKRKEHFERIHQCVYGWVWSHLSCVV